MHTSMVTAMVKRANRSGELLCHVEGRELPALAPNPVLRKRFCRRLYSF